MLHDKIGDKCTADAIRERVLVALAVISRPELAQTWSGLEPEKIGYQLCRLWFEEAYEPSLWTVDGLKGYRDSARLAAFEEAFDEEERAFLERFNRFIELRLEMTSLELRRGGAIDPDRWQGVVRDARNTLDLIEPNFQVSRSTIIEVISPLALDEPDDTRDPGAPDDVSPNQ